MSVVTQSEGAPGLQKMAEGLMMRYESAGQTPPCLLYTDRDCCSQCIKTLISVSNLVDVNGCTLSQQNR